MHSIASGVDHDVEWEIRTSSDDPTEPDLHTSLRLVRLTDGKASQLGFAGPAVHSGDRMNFGWGQADGFPPYFLARLLPDVEATVRVTTDRRTVEIDPATQGHHFGGLIYISTLLEPGEAFISAEL